ncbi:hypothetical protein PAMP_016386 [Pampus punctatissimus]
MSSAATVNRPTNISCETSPAVNWDVCVFLPRCHQISKAWQAVSQSPFSKAAASSSSTSSTSSSSLSLSVSLPGQIGCYLASIRRPLIGRFLSSTGCRRQAEQRRHPRGVERTDPRVQDKLNRLDTEENTG